MKTKLTILMILLIVLLCLGCSEEEDSSDNPSVDGDEETEDDDDDDVAEDGDDVEPEEDGDDVDGDLSDGDDHLEDGDEELAEEEEVEDEEEAPWRPTSFVANGLCETVLHGNTTFEVDANGPDTQIHPAAAFDGGGVWVTYNLPDDTNGFDIILTRLNCDGTVSIAPMVVNTTDFNEIDPDIAFDGQHILVVWQSDNGESPRNLDIYMRIYNLDGTSLTDTDMVYRAVHEGSEEDVNGWMAKAAGLPGGGFLLSGIYAPEEMQRWQAFVQRLDTTGQANEEVIRVAPNGTLTQSYIDVGVLDDGQARIGYTSEPDEGNGQAVVTGLTTDSQTPDPQVPVSVSDADYSGGSVAFGTDCPYMAYTVEGSAAAMVGIREVTDLTNLGQELLVGESRTFSHTADITGGADGGLVAYYRLIAGFRNDLILQWFSANETSLSTLEPSQLINDAPVPPYQPCVIAIGDDISFVTWAEGDNPAFRIKGRFVRFETP